ncbi:unnamed protein product [Calypogeia fissa]
MLDLSFVGLAARPGLELGGPMGGFSSWLGLGVCVFFLVALPMYLDGESDLVMGWAAADEFDLDRQLDWLRQDSVAFDLVGLNRLRLRHVILIWWLQLLRSFLMSFLWS